MLPGVLGGWRPALQGKQRADWQSLDRSNIFVQTSYGQVQGFKVYLYDNPDPRSGYRPGMSQVERIMGNVSVFLGIPYALPPVGEGRFRVSKKKLDFLLNIFSKSGWGLECLDYHIVDFSVTSYCTF